MNTLSNGAAVKIYVQGSCFRSKDAPAGWAAVLIHGLQQKALSGGIESGTSNRAEIIAATEALRALKLPSDVTFYTDNSVFQIGIEKLEKRRQNNWKDGSKPIPNCDLWALLIEAAIGHRIKSVFLPKTGGMTPHEPYLVKVSELAKQAYTPYIGAYIKSQEDATGTSIFANTEEPSTDSFPF